MIGRDGPVNRMHTIRWALAQAEDPRLTPLAAHLLLVLACHGDQDAKSFAGVARLQRKTKHGRSGVHRAMRLLEDLQLVWSKQGGHGRTATRELLFDPASDSLDEPAMRPSRNGLAVPPDGLLAASSPAHGIQQSHGRDTEEQEKGTPRQHQDLKSQGSSPLRGTASPTRPERNGLRRLSPDPLDLAELHRHAQQRQLVR